MEYQRIINLLDNTPNQLTKFKTKIWVEINDESNGLYNTGSQIKCKTSILRSSLCDYSDAYILVSGTITVTQVASGGENSNIQIVIKNCALFTACTSKIKKIDFNADKAVMAMYHFI